MKYDKFKTEILDGIIKNNKVITFKLLDLKEVMVEVDRNFDHLEELMRLNLDND